MFCLEYFLGYLETEKLCFKNNKDYHMLVMIQNSSTKKQRVSSRKRKTPYRLSKKHKAPVSVSEEFYSLEVFLKSNDINLLELVDFIREYKIQKTAKMVAKSVPDSVLKSTKTVDDLKTLVKNQTLLGYKLQAKNEKDSENLVTALKEPSSENDHLYTSLLKDLTFLLKKVKYLNKHATIISYILKLLVPRTWVKYVAAVFTVLISLVNLHTTFQS